MSYTEIYGFEKNSDSCFIGEVHNAFRGAMAMWTYLEDKYLPPYDPYKMGKMRRNKWNARYVI